MVYCVSHGGLGNQLFQVFFALLYAKGQAVKYYHDDRYYHGFKSEIPDNEYLVKCNAYEGLLLGLRIPKILKKINKNNSEYLKLLFFNLIDGYFQCVSDYEDYTKDEIIITKHKIKSIFGEWPDVKYRVPLYHLRLGDFFKTENEQIEYVYGRLKEIPVNSALISNRDDIFKSHNLYPFCEEYGLKYYETGGFTSMELIKFMSCFEKINSNGSTLAFWAGYLGDCHVCLNNNKLQALYDYLF